MQCECSWQAHAPAHGSTQAGSPLTCVGASHGAALSCSQQPQRPDVHHGRAVGAPQVLPRILKANVLQGLACSSSGTTQAQQHTSVLNRRMPSLPVSGQHANILAPNHSLPGRRTTAGYA